MTNQQLRNFRLGVSNGILFILAETLMDPTLVMVAFLSQLTSSPILLGLVVPLRDGAWALPQLWVSCYLQSVARKIEVYRRLSYVRITCWAISAAVINFIHEPALVLIAFFLSYSISSVASGLSGLPFMEVVSKTIPGERRGEFYAWRMGMGGLFSIGGSIFVRWIIDPTGPLAYPYNYGLLSFLYFALASISLLLYNQVEEPEDLKTLPRASFPAQFQRAICFFRLDARYRKFILVQSLLMIAGSATPFFAVYVQQSLGGSKAMVGVYLGVMMATNLASNVLLGRTSRRVGNHRVMLIATVAGLLMSVFVLLLSILAEPLKLSPEVASAWLLPVFALSGLRGTGIGIAGNALLLEIAPPESRSLYVGFFNTFTGIVLLATFTSGIVMAAVGFHALVLMTLAAHMFAFWLAVRFDR